MCPLCKARFKQLEVVENKPAAAAAAAPGGPAAAPSSRASARSRGGKKLRIATRNQVWDGDFYIENLHQEEDEIEVLPLEQRND